MTLTEEYEAALASATTIIDGAKAGNRNLTAKEQGEVGEKLADIKRISGLIEEAKGSDNLLKAFSELPTNGGGKQKNLSYEESQAVRETLGMHFRKEAGDQLLKMKSVKGASVSSVTEWGVKAAGDTHVVGSWATPLLTEFDRTFVTAPRPRLVVADLLSQGTLSGNAITYFVEGGIEGGFTTVAEGAAKPSLHFIDPTAVTDALKKIAGYITLSDEMIEDLDFVVSEIDTRLQYELAKFEEQQILNGNGTGTNIRGILQRSGIQTETSADFDDNADAVFRAMTKVSTGAELAADGLVIHPLDYQDFRLSKDGNGQYYGGGYFQGPYGNGQVLDQPPLWGLRTVVTPAIAQGSALVGAFQQAATLYGKGGVRVESTNSHADNFTTNKVTVRAETRRALAVRKPAGFVVVSFADEE